MRQKLIYAFDKNLMDFLPKVIEDIIMDYKAQLEHSEKMDKKCGDGIVLHWYSLHLVTFGYPLPFYPSPTMK